VKVIGDKALIARFRREAKSAPSVADGIEHGLKKAGLMLQAESQRLVPVETGNLRASAFTRAVGQGIKTVVTVGYTAFYAAMVHEAFGVLKGQPRKKPAKGKYWDPKGQPKFLETPMRRLRDKLAAIVAKEAKIK
jgi:hypothetical protein